MMVKAATKTKAVEDTSEAVTETENGNGKAKRTKRADAPFAIFFDDGKSSDNSRVPPNAKAVVVKIKDMDSIVLTLKDVPTANILNLALFGLGRRTHTFVNNHSEKTEDIPGLVNKLFTELATGEYYTKPEPKAKPVKDYSADIAQFIESYRLTCVDKVKAKVLNKKGVPLKVPSDDELARLNIKFTAMPRKDFNELKKERLGDATFKRHWMTLEVAKLKKLGKDQDSGEMDELI